jgi:hypothetical protein
MNIDEMEKSVDELKVSINKLKKVGMNWKSS